MIVTPARAIDDPRLLGGAFVGASWDRWRAVLKAAFAEPMSAAELASFREVAERDPPPRRVRELWAIAGRRSGKDSIASAVAGAAAVGDYSAHLRPGERACVMCLACDREQARIVHRYVVAYFRANPMLAALVVRETDDGLELSNGVEVVVATNSYRAVRGRTVVVAIFDEVAYWRSEESATPDVETYGAIAPALVTIPGAMLVGISTAYRRSGLLYEKWRAHYGRADDDVLVVKGESRQFNPTLPRPVIDRALARDPEAAAAEWLSAWRSDLADFVDRAAVAAAVAPGVRERPPVASVSYRAFVDPSGGSSDSMTLAVAHRDADGRAVLDALRERRPPFSPESVVREFAALLRAYNVSRVSGDRYAGEWPRERFRERGVEYEPSARAKSDVYLAFLPLLNSGAVDLLDEPRLAAQLCGLERRTARGGRDSIDHPPGAHDDLINAAAGALVEAAGRSPCQGWLDYYRDLAAEARRPSYAPRPDPAVAPDQFGRPRASAPRPPVTLRSPLPWQCFCFGAGRRFASDGERLIRGVDPSDAPGLIDAGCEELPQ